jgi:dCMP deaminase
MGPSYVVVEPSVHRNGPLSELVSIPQAAASTQHVASARRMRPWYTERRHSGMLACSQVEGDDMARVPWDEYFMNIATVVASRSTCPRKFVGSVIVRDKTILSTGYNGSIRGMPHCTDEGHMMENDHCVATIHAEANAIIQAAKNGVVIDGATIYVTASPCWSCFKMIANGGIRRICYGEFYRDDRIFSIAERLAIELVHIKATMSVPAA